MSSSDCLAIVTAPIALAGATIAFATYKSALKRTQVEHTLKIFDAFWANVSEHATRLGHGTDTARSRAQNNEIVREMMRPLGEATALLVPLTEALTNLPKEIFTLSQAVPIDDVALTAAKKLLHELPEKLELVRLKATQPTVSPPNFSRDLREVINFLSHVGILLEYEVIDETLYFRSFATLTLELYFPIADVIEVDEVVSQSDSSEITRLAKRCQGFVKRQHGSKKSYLVDTKIAEPKHGAALGPFWY